VGCTGDGDGFHRLDTSGFHGLIDVGGAGGGDFCWHFGFLFFIFRFLVTRDACSDRSNSSAVGSAKVIIGSVLAQTARVSSKSKYYISYYRYLSPTEQVNLL